MASFRSGGSKQNLRVLFTFSTITKLLTHVTGSSTLAIIFFFKIIRVNFILSISLNDNSK